MAALQNRNGSFRVIFRHDNKQQSIPVGDVTEGEAEAFLGKVEHLLLRIKQQWVQVPAGVTIKDFILADGQVKTPEQATKLRDSIKFGDLMRAYFEAYSIRPAPSRCSLAITGCRRRNQ